ncbi:MAG: formylglycine-generating enzyme family protein [Deltaproteobacteria bacterium]|nr:formylglycine-generating enzyme family protein [Deltaproteobacteria bacterium]
MCTGCGDETSTNKDLALIRKGAFWMGTPSGCPGPEGYPGDCRAEDGRQNGEVLHKVTLTHDFFIMRHEITQREYFELMGKYSFPIYLEAHPPDVCLDCPANFISRYTAFAVANQLSIAHGLPPCYKLSEVQCEINRKPKEYMDCYKEEETGCREWGTDEHGNQVCKLKEVMPDGIAHAKIELNHAGTVYDCTGYRLPTEAEWEYAARAGSNTAIYPSPGNDGTISHLECEFDENLDKVAWYCGNTELPKPVGLKAPNAWGLYDMLGNVSEWIWGGCCPYEVENDEDGVVDPYCLYKPDTTNPVGGRRGLPNGAAYTRCGFRGCVSYEGQFIGNGFSGVRLVRTVR